MQYREELAAALSELERIWVEAGDSSTLSALNPGAEEAAIRRTWHDVPGELPEEAVIWWNWHDGGRPGRGPAIGASHLEFLTLTEARNQYDVMVDLGLSAHDASLGEMSERDWTSTGFHPAWIPIAVGPGGDLVTLDTRVTDGPSPVRSTSAGDSDSGKVDAASLLVLVRGWLELYATGVYLWDGYGWTIPNLKRIPRAMHPFW